MHWTRMAPVPLATLAAVMATAPGAANEMNFNYARHPGYIVHKELERFEHRAQAGPAHVEVAGHGTRTYVARGEGGLDIVDRNAGTLGFYDDAVHGVVATADPNCIWICGEGYLQALDVSDPTSPQPIGPEISFPGDVVFDRISLSGTTLLIQDTDTGEAHRIVLFGPCGPVTSIDGVPDAENAKNASDVHANLAALVGDGVLLIADFSVTPITTALTTVPGGVIRDVVVTEDQRVVVTNDDGLTSIDATTLQTVDQNPDLTGIDRLGRGPDGTIVGMKEDAVDLIDAALARLATVATRPGSAAVTSDGGFTVVHGTGSGLTYGRYGNRMAPPVAQRVSDVLVPDEITFDHAKELYLVSHAGGMSGGSVDVYDGANPCALALRSRVDATAIRSIAPFEFFTGAGVGRGTASAYAVLGGALSLEILDYTDPDAPVIVGSLASSSSQVAAAPDGSRVIRSVQSPALGFHVVDVTDPTTPFDRGFGALPNAVNDALVDGTFALVATTAETARWDVSDADAPVVDQTAPYTGVQAVAASASPDQYYLGGTIGDDRRIVRYDFATATELGAVDVGARSLSVVTTGASFVGGGEIVYAGDATGTLYVIDWSDAAAPILVGEYTEPGLTMKNVVGTENAVVVTNGSFPGDVVVLPAQGNGVTTGTPDATAPGPSILGVGRPNPFRATTRMTLTLEDAGHVRVDVYDVAGRRVRELLTRTMPAGRHTVAWDGRNAAGAFLPNGVYFVRLESGRTASRRKLHLVR